MADAAIEIRAATIQDVESLARLASQLGYPANAAQMSQRLKRLPADGTVVLVAATESLVIGWIHMQIYPTILDDHAAEVLGFVVEESWRSQGVGHQLMRSAETWAADHGCSVLYVRTNIVRQRARHFYLRYGFRQLKTSYTFVKQLPESNQQG
jgi:PhnO protein